MALSFKWLTVPVSNKTVGIAVVEMWEVRWESRHGQFADRADLCSAKPELECFTVEADARAFATSLRNAFALLRYSGGGRTVSLEKAKGG